MSNHAQVSAGSQNWAILLPEVLAHIVEQLNAVLPEQLTLMVAGPQVVLSTTTGRPRVIATETLTIPAEIDRAGLATSAAVMLADVQDLVVTHLRRPWPTTTADRSTYPAAELVGTSLVLRFSTRDDADAIVLQAYSVPENPPPVVVAG
jgi:hypothetical protein